MILKPCEGFEIKLEDFNVHTFNCHVNIDKDFRGKIAVNACKILIDGIFKTTDKTKLVAFIPKSQRHIRLFVSQLGFKKEGCLTKFSAEHKEDTLILSLNKGDE